MNFDELIIYYFSGTGNARSVAQWIKHTAELKKIDTHIIDIAKLKKREIQQPAENTVIGICSPTHGFNFPPIVLNFIARFPKARKNRLFLINTRAGLKIGKRFVPGLSGIALLWSALLLKIKGYRIIGMRSIDLPSNWISIHPGLKKTVVESLFKRRKEDTVKFITKLSGGEKDFRAFRDIIQDVLIAPVSVLYYLIGRFVFAKSFIASKACTHCNLCIEKCPVKAIKIIDNRCYWTHKCESCMQCMNLCPHKAIETAHGFIIGISFLIYSVLLVWIYTLLNIEQFVQSFSAGGLRRLSLMIFNSAIFLVFLFLFYRIMHYLMRFSIVERFITISSLTTYKFWRRYKPPKP